MAGSNERANSPGVLADHERKAVEAMFGVGVEQVRRDHAISHALAAISAIGTVQVQLLSPIGYPVWPTEVLDIHQRYSDAPPARLRVLTAEAFAAAELAAWHDRGSPRDLYDLWALAELGSINREAGALFARFGPTTQPSVSLSPACQRPPNGTQRSVTSASQRFPPPKLLQ